MILRNLLRRQNYILGLAILAIATSNMYVAAIPSIQLMLATSAHAIQLTISYYMLGLSLGILFYGPASDHYGRKPILICGLIIYIIGVLLSVMGHNIQLFSISRIIQAFGAASALSLWQALAVDVYKKDSGKVITAGYITIGFVPALSPFIGSYLTAHLGWHSIFLFLAVYGAFLLAMTILFPETKEKMKESRNNHHWIMSSFQNYSKLLKSKQFLFLALLSSSLYSMIYVFMTQTPSLLHQLGYGSKMIGLFFVPISAAFISGSMLARFALKKVKPSVVIMRGACLVILGGILQLILHLAVLDHNWVSLITPFSIMTIGGGMTLPVVVSKAMSLFTDISGASASFIGASQNLIAFFLSAVSASLGQLGLLGLALSLLALAVLIISKEVVVIRKGHI